MKNFELLFLNLDSAHLEPEYSTGRKPVSRQALLRAIILMNLKSIRSLTELRTVLKENPCAAECCGFDLLKPPPSVERFSSFLRDTDNLLIQKIRIGLVQRLINLKVISGKYLSIDSCPIVINVKENNLKTNVKNRFNKTRFCAGDPDARIGVIVTFAKSKKEVSYFWGYRDHVVCDAASELPVWHITKPANVQDSVMFIPIFDKIQEEFKFNICAVMADGIYDTASIIKHVLNKLEAKPRIAPNVRNNSAKTERKFSKNNNPICEANLEMLYRGTFYDKKQDRWRRKWVCPIHHSKKYIHEFFVCPVFHPKFFSQKGCYAYIRVDDDIRTKVDYGSESFKKDFNMRTGSERIFSRLLSICMQHPPVIGLKAISNYTSIAHISMLLVAITAAEHGMKDKVRFIKSFLPNFNP